jgi:hypothetical protein
LDSLCLLSFCDGKVLEFKNVVVEGRE